MIGSMEILLRENVYCFKSNASLLLKPGSVVFVLENMYMVRFYSHEAMIYCYIPIDGIVCVQLFIGFIACRMPV